MSEEEIEIQESEEEIEDEVQIETSDLVKWTESEYANQNWDGFQIPVIDGNLDPDIVTRRTPPPQSGASHTLIISEQTALKNYGEVDPPMSIYIDPNKILDDLVRNNPQITSLVDTRNLSDEQLFSTVVLEMSNLWNGKYHGGKLPSTREFEKQTGSGVVINTSFNVRGEPIVCSPEDSYKCFMRTEMDVLTIENFILLKEEQPDFSDKEDWQKLYELD